MMVIIIKDYATKKGDDEEAGNAKSQIFNLSMHSFFIVKCPIPVFNT